jgi:hypothetical protein
MVAGHDPSGVSILGHMRKTRSASRLRAVVSLLILAGYCVAPTLAQQPDDTRKKASGPIAKLKESVVCCPLDTVLLDGWASISPGGEIVKWMWDLNGDHQIDTSTTSGEVQIIAPSTPCSRTVYLTVKDRTGAVSKPDSILFHVMNSPPRVVLAADTTIKVGVRVSFAPTLWCNCGKPVMFEWDFNDDGQADYRSDVSGNTSRLYQKAGRYTARFRVVDALGREAGAVERITVLAEQPR